MFKRLMHFQCSSCTVFFTCRYNPMDIADFVDKSKSCITELVNYERIMWSDALGFRARKDFTLKYCTCE